MINTRIEMLIYLRRDKYRFIYYTFYYYQLASANVFRMIKTEFTYMDSCQLRHYKPNITSVVHLTTK